MEARRVAIHCRVHQCELIKYRCTNQRPHVPVSTVRNFRFGVKSAYVRLCVLLVRICPRTQTNGKRSGRGQWCVTRCYPLSTCGTYICPNVRNFRTLVSSRCQLNTLLAMTNNRMYSIHTGTVTVSYRRPESVSDFDVHSPSSLP